MTGTSITWHKAGTIGPVDNKLDSVLARETALRCRGKAKRKLIIQPYRLHTKQVIDRVDTAATKGRIAIARGIDNGTGPAFHCL